MGIDVVSAILYCMQPDEIGFSQRTDAQGTALRPLRYRLVSPDRARRGPLRTFDWTLHHGAAEFGRWNGEDFDELLWRTNAVVLKNVIRLQIASGFRLIRFLLV